MGSDPARVKPRLRGVFHEAAFYLFAVLAMPLVLTAQEGKARISAFVFALCVALCFGASGLSHRPTGQPRPRPWLPRARPPRASPPPVVARARPPRRHLPADRGDLHAVRPARPLARMGDPRTDDRLDGVA